MSEQAGFNTRPIWFDASVIPKQTPQSAQVCVDVCIIGGGITGITTAEFLKREGKTVAVVELDRIARGETGHTSGHITEVFDIGYHELIANFGLEGAKIGAQAMRRAVEKIEESAAKKGIDCSLERVSAWKFTSDKTKIDELEEEAEAAARIGVPCTLSFEVPLPFHVERGLRFDRQAQFNSIAYVAGMVRGIAGDGSYIFEETRMLEIEEGEPCRVKTDRGTIIADDVIVSANVPSSNRLLLHTKIAAYRTYAIAARVKDAHAWKNLYWDMEDPYHYIRTFELHGVPHLIVGGEDHKTGKGDHAALHFQKLDDWTRERFPVESITHRWSGQVIEPVDGLPFIGRNTLSDRVFVATGFSGNGLAGGTLAAMLLTDLITGVNNPALDLFGAGRVKPLAGLKNFVAENLDFPSHLIGDRFAGTQEDTKHLREGEGAIVRVGTKKMAAYRDEQGELHTLSPVCPHMGCYVHWNDAERSWDCPCHGSRFAPTGKLLNGPAVADLASEDYDENLPMIPERYDQPQETGIFGTPILSSVFTCPLKPRSV